MDIGARPIAWIGFPLFLLVLVVVLYFRAKSEGDAESKLIEKIAEKLDVKIEHTASKGVRKVIKHKKGDRDK